MMTKKTNSMQFFSFIVASIMLFLLISCNTPQATTPPPTLPTSKPPTATATEVPTATTIPTATPVPVIPNTGLTLMDGSIVILKPGARIEVLKQPGLPVQSQEVVVKLIKGEILVISGPTSKTWITVQNPVGTAARLQGCAMIVSYDTILDSFEMKCLGNKCEISADPETFLPVSLLFSQSYKKGKLLDPTKIDSGQLAIDYKDDFPACVIAALPTATPTATKIPATKTPDAAATATAACTDFHQKFPATPCPK